MMVCALVSVARVICVVRACLSGARSLRQGGSKLSHAKECVLFAQVVAVACVSLLTVWGRWCCVAVMMVCALVSVARVICVVRACLSGASSLRPGDSKLSHSKECVLFWQVVSVACAPVYREQAPSGREAASCLNPRGAFDAVVRAQFPPGHVAALVWCAPVRMLPFFTPSLLRCLLPLRQNVPKSRRYCYHVFSLGGRGRRSN